MAVGSPDDLTGLESCLVETDPDSTEIVVVATQPPDEATARGKPEQTDAGGSPSSKGSRPEPTLSEDCRKLMTAVVHRSELAGKPVKPVVILTEERSTALVQVTYDVGAEELIIPPDGKDPTALLDRTLKCWGKVNNNKPARLTVRIVGKGIDGRRDIEGGSRIPLAADDGGETARSLAGSRTD